MLVPNQPGPGGTEPKVRDQQQARCDWATEKPQSVPHTPERCLQPNQTIQLRNLEWQQALRS